MDFVMPLPMSQGFDAILVVVDRLTKMAHFIPTYTTVDTLGVAKLIISEVVRLHGLPADIVSDRGTVFTSRIWEQLCARLGIDRKLSTAYHPQTDGQTERVNQIMEQYLRAYCNYRQDDWRELLPVAEFSYNNGDSATTNLSPFAANYGFNPKMDFMETVTSVGDQGELVLKNISDIQGFAKQEIRLAQERYKRFADLKRQPEPGYSEGEYVWLSTDNLKTTRPMKKLDYQWIGPYKVIRKIKDSAYALELPATMKIHNVFHPSKLKKKTTLNAPPRNYVPPDMPVVIEGQEFHEVEAILDSRRRGRSVQYLVHWKGYGINDRTWEPYRMLYEDVPNLLAIYHREHPGKPDGSGDIIGSRGSSQPVRSSRGPRRAESSGPSTQ